MRGVLRFEARKRRSIPGVQLTKPEWKALAGKRAQELIARHGSLSRAVVADKALYRLMEETLGHVMDDRRQLRIEFSKPEA